MPTDSIGDGLEGYDEIFDREETVGLPDDIEIAILMDDTTIEEINEEGADEYFDRQRERVKDCLEEEDEIYDIQVSVGRSNRHIYREVWIFYREEDEA